MLKYIIRHKSNTELAMTLLSVRHECVLVSMCIHVLMCQKKKKRGRKDDTR